MTVAVASRHFGMAGAIVGFFALAVAVLPFWVLPAVFPPKPVDQVVVETAQRIKDRLVAKATGVDYQSSENRDPALVWYRACSIVAVSLGVIAIGFAAFSFLRRERWRYSAIATVLGGTAIVFELAVMVLAALVLIAILVAVLRHFDISF